jgi:hypothetical protein
MDHLLTIQIDFPDDFDLANARETIFLFEQRCNAVLQESQLGELDGDEWSRARCIIYCYGPDANRLFAVVKDCWEFVDLNVGATVVRRFGALGCPEEQDMLPAKSLGITRH